MQLIYGSFTPIRLLEEILYWKNQEKRHAKIIQHVIPQLEADYAHLLSQWEHVFAQTEEAANVQFHRALQHPDNLASTQLQQLEELNQAAIHQSEQLLHQLEAVKRYSQTIQTIPFAAIIIDYMADTSQYFLHRSRPMVNKLLPTNHPTVAINAVNKATRSNHLQPEQSPLTQGIQARIGRTRPSHTVAEKITSAQTCVPIGGHKLPPLPYDYNALEPYIDQTTMSIHHDKHHQSYVNGLNKAELALAEARKLNHVDLINYWENELAFNGAGHYLHTIFWETMNPKGGGKPSGNLLRQIEQDFGSFEAFKKQFSTAAEKIEGSGWTILVWSPRSRRLEILQAEKHQNGSQWDVVPLLPLDVWEHAYYLKHENNRHEYINNWWNVVYWTAVSARFEQARHLTWPPF